ncbi:MAG: hypothetical protein A3J51_01270 [Omnitrophica WOR_2 bacterium RIFCSPHIGHO2_02_FULL_45_21]|nr:MAG: hypothetical protein A3J51_01270 [Omnitrophica WOR_2 bacterium RIFCSPHIGHO2_02_FULL_45_21]
MVNSVLETGKKEISLRTMVKHYLKRAREIESYLAKNPNEWGKFQSEFNAELNGVFRNIMNFEKENLINGRDDRVYKLRRLFVNRFREIFVRGDYIDWSLRKPFGYAGDFKIIDDIYQNNPATAGFARLFDNYFQMSTISVAVRNRKEDFKRLVTNFIKDRGKDKLRIMDLACGPCRDIRELIRSDNLLCENVIFDCYDNDLRAIEFSKASLANQANVNFFQKNAARIALHKDVNSMIDKKYDLIFSTGLFDYFGERIAIALVQNIKKLLKPNGIMAISNVRDKYSNPSVHFMEWAGEWNLVYRDDDDFRKIFIAAGFKENELKVQYEQQGVMEYIIAANISKLE